MYKVMITTHDSNDEGFCIADDFETEEQAWNAVNAEDGNYPEAKDIWVEHQSIIDEFGIESAENIMNTADDYLLDNGTHL